MEDHRYLTKDMEEKAVLRAIQAGLTLTDLDNLEHGFIADMLTELANDDCKYQQLATQEDMDNF